MDSPTDAVDPVLMATSLTPADPQLLKLAFVQMVDKVIEIADEHIIDWDTMVVDSLRVLNPDTGQTVIRMRLGVKCMEVTL